MERAHRHYLVDQTASPAGTSLPPRLIYTGVVEEDPTWFNFNHTHNFCEILYVSNGSGQADIGGTLHQLVKGDLVIYNPSVTHREWSAADEKMQLLFCSFDSFKLPGLPENHLLAGGKPPVTPTGRYQVEVEQLLRGMIEETSQKQSNYYIMSNTLLSALLIVMLRLLDPEKTQDSKAAQMVAQVKSYLNENFASPTTIESLSEIVFVSPGHLSHVFKDETGVSPIKYLITRRMEEASRLLLHTDLPIKEIASKVGYDNPMYFSQIFKKVVGVSPNAFRKETP